jgi:hypothetical protein
LARLQNGRWTEGLYYIAPGPALRNRRISAFACSRWHSKHEPPALPAVPRANVRDQRGQSSPALSARACAQTGESIYAPSFAMRHRSVVDDMNEQPNYTRGLLCTFGPTRQRLFVARSLGAGCLGPENTAFQFNTYKRIPAEVASMPTRSTG